ncbi:hypothetical protein ALQ18_100289, partial [Pseudomonas marginalis pv. marginalis]
MSCGKVPVPPGWTDQAHSGSFEGYARAFQPQTFRLLPHAGIDHHQRPARRMAWHGLRPLNSSVTDARFTMAQYVFTMHRLGKVVPPKREILKNISLSFFPGAKIGVLGLNGSGKSTLLKIMAGVDTEFEGEARPMPELNIGYLPQEPILDPTKTVREVVEEAVSVIKNAQARLDEVYAAYAEEDADFDKLAAEQAKLEAILQAGDGHNLERQLEVAADALRLPAWDAKIEFLSGGEKRRVALCRLLLSAPDMLLLDEP